MPITKSNSATPLGRELVNLLGPASIVLSRPADLIAYSYDATGDRALPNAVVLPADTAAASRLLHWAHARRLPIVPRGAGTNLSGGTVPVAGGIVVEMSRAKHVLAVDAARRRAVVGPGITNLALQDYLAPLGYCFAPDPASQKVSTLGGNVGENAGGPHCLKYGVTADHIEGLVAVQMDGRVLRLGEMADGSAGPPERFNCTRALVGSEGTLALFTEIMVRIEPLPPAVKTILAVYDRLEDAGRSVSEIIARRMLPATLELMDRTTLNVIEESYHLGYPTDAEGALLIELDGPAPGLERQAAMIEKICRDLGARSATAAKDAAERARLWLGRRSAFGALARRSPSYSVQDATVPRDRLVEMMRHVEDVARKHLLEIAIVAHAGDGNLHPIVLYREPTPERMAKVHAANAEILARAVAMGGTISGEHGVGLEKLEYVPLALEDAAINLMRRVKEGFDPAGLLNPNKAIPAAPADGKTCAGPVVGGPAETPRGSGTRMAWVLPADLASATRQSEPIDGGVHIDSGNLTLRAPATTPSETIRATITEHGFWLPALDHGWHGTLGGDVATAQASPTDAQLGGVGRWVLGARLELPGGERVILGGQTMKNVTGYNLLPLVTGSWGQLGRIEELTMRLWPRPEADMTLTSPLTEWLAHASTASLTQPGEIAAGWGAFDSLVRLTRPVAVWAIGGPTGGTVAVRLAGATEDVAWAAQLWRAAHASLQDSCAGGVDAWASWRMPWHAAATRGELRGWRASPAMLQGFLRVLGKPSPGPTHWSACLISGAGYAAGDPGELEWLERHAGDAGVPTQRLGWHDAAQGMSEADDIFLRAFGCGGLPLEVQ